MYTYIPQGVCPKFINVELDGDKVKHIEFLGGCPGNLKAISKISEGHRIDELAELWEGNTCGKKPTSCTDQLIKALRAAKAAGEGQPS